MAAGAVLRTTCTGLGGFWLLFQGAFIICAGAGARVMGALGLRSRRTARLMGAARADGPARIATARLMERAGAWPAQELLLRG